VPTAHTDLVKGLPKSDLWANENMVILQLGCDYYEFHRDIPHVIAFNS